MVTKTGKQNGWYGPVFQKVLIQTNLKTIRLQVQKQTLFFVKERFMILLLGKEDTYPFAHRYVLPKNESAIYVYKTQEKNAFT